VGVWGKGSRSDPDSSEGGRGKVCSKNPAYGKDDFHSGERRSSSHKTKDVPGGKKPRLVWTLLIGQSYPTCAKVVMKKGGGSKKTRNLASDI